MGGTSHWIEVEPIPEVKQKKLGPRVFNRIWARIRKYVYNVVGGRSSLYEQVMTEYFDCITDDSGIEDQTIQFTFTGAAGLCEMSAAVSAHFVALAIAHESFAIAEILESVGYRMTSPPQPLSELVRRRSAEWIIVLDGVPYCVGHDADDDSLYIWSDDGVEGAVEFDGLSKTHQQKVRLLQQHEYCLCKICWRERAHLEPPLPHMQLSRAIRLNDESALHKAIKAGAVLDMPEQSLTGGTALLSAIGYGRPDFVRILLESGADPNATDNNDNSPLMGAAGNNWYSDHKCEISGYLDMIDAGANVHHVSTTGKTALHAAIGSFGVEHPELVERVLDHGADLHWRDPADRTPLHYAIAGQPRGTEILIRRGAEIDARDASGLTPLMIAVNHKTVNLGLHEPHKKQLDIIGQLQAANANVNAASPDGSTPLMIACAGLRSEYVRLLVDANADVSLRNGEGQTAEDIAREVELYRDFPESRAAIIEMLQAGS
ncbi:MAG: ankyrin repeat domain-containing protein [Planctomycetota bacterium]|nr:ankyrin repeat domain-containing protein [Planctomycetota bacterium]